MAENETVPQTKPKIQFRNYKPYDQTLLKKTSGVESNTNVDPSIVKPTKLDPPSIDKSASVSDRKTLDPIQEELKKVESQLGTKELNIIPQKANWDLKRHAEFKIEKLRKRTQRAIVEILREKLQDCNEEETSDEEID
jgi:coiled-coil domain-containing protein 12